MSVLFIPTDVSVERGRGRGDHAEHREMGAELDCLFNNAGGGGANGPIASIPEGALR